MAPRFRTPSLARCEKAAGPAADWAGRCHEVACLLNERLKLGLRLAYGHWLGPVHPDSSFADRRRVGFVRHGWLVLADRRVFDPTRWVFEAAAPYLYVGAADHYDEGGDFLRRAAERVREVPGPEHDDRMVPLDVAEADTRLFVVEIFDRLPEELNLAQVHYLATLSRATLGEHAESLYRAIVDAGHRATIPVDNRRLVLGDYDGPRTPGRAAGRDRRLPRPRRGR